MAALHISLLLAASLLLALLCFSAQQDYGIYGEYDDESPYADEYSDIYDQYYNDSMAAQMQQSIEELDSSTLENMRIENQDRIDTIMRAFKRLPAPELERLQVDISVPIVDGTVEAENLVEAWYKRQEELKAAMASMVKPAEHMQKLLAVAKPGSVVNLRPGQPAAAAGAASSAAKPEAQAGAKEELIAEGKEERLENRITALVEMESLVADVDNARDLHTIGGWPILVSLLHEHEPTAIRTHAAWAIGTAIKNFYDYQLWVLEPVSIITEKRARQNSPTDSVGGGVAGIGADSSSSSRRRRGKRVMKTTCLELLVDILHNYDDFPATDSSDAASAVIEGGQGVSSERQHSTSEEFINEPIEIDAEDFAAGKFSSIRETAARVSASVGMSFKVGADPAVEQQELLKRVLYAISSAVRGNIDVQNSLMIAGQSTLSQMFPHPDDDSFSTDGASSIEGEIPPSGDNSRTATGKNTVNGASPPGGKQEQHVPRYAAEDVVFMQALSDIASDGNNTSPDLMRKVWAFASDMLEERRYIRQDLTAAIQDTVNMMKDQADNVEEDSGDSASASVGEEGGIGLAGTRGAEARAGVGAGAAAALGFGLHPDDLASFGIDERVMNDPASLRKESEILTQDLQDVLSNQLFGDFFVDSPHWTGLAVEVLRTYILKLFAIVDDRCYTVPASIASDLASVEEGGGGANEEGETETEADAEISEALRALKEATAEIDVSGVGSSNSAARTARMQRSKQSGTQQSGTAASKGAVSQPQQALCSRLDTSALNKERVSVTATIANILSVFRESIEAAATATSWYESPTPSSSNVDVGAADTHTYDSKTVLQGLLTQIMALPADGAHDDVLDLAKEVLRIM